MTQPTIVPAGYGQLVSLQAGECLAVINTYGTQVVDTWAFNGADPAECMSMAQSRSVNSRLFASPGQCFVSTRRRAMLRLIEDTSLGDHDTLLCACNSAIYRELGCTGYHRSCEDNLHETLATVGITLPFTPAPLNLFMNVGVGPSGTVLRRPPSSRPGDRVVLQAEMDLHVVMSACPQDMTPINGDERMPQNVAVEVSGIAALVRFSRERAPTGIPALAGAGEGTLWTNDFNGPGLDSAMQPIYVDFLNGPDIAALDMTDDDILGAIEASLAAQGRKQTVIEPRMHLKPDPAVDGHFNVLRGAIGGDVQRAGVKVVSDFVYNYKQGLPSEMAILALFDPKTGKPQAIMDAGGITDMRTGAVTAIGAKYLARKDSKILGHIGARGTAYWNVRLLDSMFHFDEIRVHSRRPESQRTFAERLSQDLGKPVCECTNWQDTVAGADIVVEASRLLEPAPLLRTEWIKPGALVMPYGTMSAVELSLTDIMSKLVVDDWGQVGAGPYGALRQHVNAGKLTRDTLHAEIGEIVAGLRPGREDDGETILFWHRGLSLSDIALGHAMLEKGRRLGIGQRLRFG